MDEAQAAAERCQGRGRRRRGGRPGGRRRTAGLAAHGLLHQGRRRQEPDRDQRRRRPGGCGLSVCLVDLDVNSGDVAIMLQLNPVANAQRPGWPSTGSSTTAPSTRSSPSTPTSLSIVAAPVRLDCPDQATAEDIGTLLDALKYRFDVDRGRHLRRVRRPRTRCPRPQRHASSWSAPWTSRRSRVSSWPRARSTCSTSDATTWRFVLNRADGKVGLSVRRVRVDARPQGRRLARLRREVLTAVNRGEPLVRAYAGHANSKAIIALRHARSRPHRSPCAGHQTLEVARLRPPSSQEGLTVSLSDRLAAATRPRGAAQTTEQPGRR